MTWLVHDPVTRLLAQIVIIVAVSRLLARAMRRLEQPMVVAEVAAGIVLGPSLVGLLWPDAYRVLFAPESLGVLQLISQLGLVLFMFIVGLELDFNLLRGRGRASVAISHASIVVPFALGAALAVQLHPVYAPAGVPLLTFALFMGAAMSITAFPVLARILAERQLTQTPIGSVAIACAAVDDVTAWCILAFVVAAARSTGMASAVGTTLVALAYIAVMVWLVRPLLGRIAARIANPQALTQAAVTVVLMLLLISSWTTELIGIHALFGAFLFGAILPRQGDFTRALAAKIEDLVLIVLLPLFFAFSGVRTQIGLLDTAEDWLICGVIILFASLGKFGASALAARATGLPWREAKSVLGVLMNTRGLMELIVLNIGLDLGVLGPELFTMMVIMALVTTFATTPMLRLLRVEELHRPAPAVPEADFAMVLCVADHRAGPGMIRLAGALRGERSSILALHLVPPSDRGSFLIEAAGRSDSTPLAPLLDEAAALGVPVRPLAFISAEPARDIAQLAGEHAADLIVLGWHKPLIGEARLGGAVYDVMRRAPCDAAVFMDRGLRSARRILVPFRGSSHDRAALRLAGRFLHVRGVELTLLQLEEGSDAPALDARALLGNSAGRVQVRRARTDSPPDAVLAELASGYDLLVVGMETEWGLEPRSFAIQPERLVLESATSLLAVRGAELSVE